MKTIIIIFILILNTYASVFQFPEERYYVPRVDTGYEQYGTPSIRGKNKIVLTFDDGPHPTYTAKILNLLKEYKVKATFFVLTHKVTKRNMPILKRIIQEGHILASHDHHHNRNDYVSKLDFENNLSKSILLVSDIYKAANIKQPGYWYRFPYAMYGGASDYHHMNSIQDVSQDLFNNNCINFTFWDIDSGDWIPGLSSKQVFKNVKSHLVGGEYITYYVEDGDILQKTEYISDPPAGGVILQHDIQKRTINATRLLLEYARNNNVEIVSMKNLPEFSYDGKSCEFID